MKHDRLAEQIVQKRARASAIKEFTDCLRDQNRLIDEFDMDLWSSLVDFVTIYNRKKIVFTFMDGTEVEI